MDFLFFKTKVPLAYAFLLVCLGNAGVPSEQPFSLNLVGPHSDVKMGDSIVCEVVLTNASTHKITIARRPGEPSPAEMTYQIEVLDESGQAVPFTEFGLRLNDPSFLKKQSRVSQTLDPGASLREVAHLSDSFAITRPGKYSFRVSRDLDPPLGQGTIKSNLITITVARP